MYKKLIILFISLVSTVCIVADKPQPSNEKNTAQPILSKPYRHEIALGLTGATALSGASRAVGSALTLRPIRMVKGAALCAFGVGSFILVDSLSDKPKFITLERFPTLAIQGRATTHTNKHTPKDAVHGLWNIIEEKAAQTNDYLEEKMKNIDYPQLANTVCARVEPCVQWAADRFDDAVGFVEPYIDRALGKESKK